MNTWGWGKENNYLHYCTHTGNFTRNTYRVAHEHSHPSANHMTPISTQVSAANSPGKPMQNSQKKNKNLRSLCAKAQGSQTVQDWNKNIVCSYEFQFLHQHAGRVWAPRQQHKPVQPICPSISSTGQGWLCFRVGKDSWLLITNRAKSDVPSPLEHHC